MNPLRRISTIALLLVAQQSLAGTTEFCLDGEFNLGYRLQHYRIADGWVPTTWCVVTEDNSNRTLFSVSGKSNPDMEGDWAVAYEPPDTVRIVNRDAPPDVEFQGTDNLEEALSVRRIDPRRLHEEYQEGPIEDVRLWVDSGRVNMALFDAILPIHGELQLSWSWHWENEDRPRLIVSTNKDNALLFRGTGRWRVIPDDEAGRLWTVTPGADKIEVPGDRWPARASTRLIELTEGVYLARGVRTGFQHLVVDTEPGLIVADAPASWLELHQIPPKRFLPDLPIDGISANLVTFLQGEFPGRPIHAVALTHFHDDHAGGAAAFAAAGAKIYASSKTAIKLGEMFRDRSHPDDKSHGNSVDIIGIAKEVTLGNDGNQVRLVPMDNNPHVFEMLGVWAVDKKFFFVSDIHVPRSDADAPAPARATTECWFANWAVARLPADVQIVNSHSPTITPVSRLENYLKSAACQD